MVFPMAVVAQSERMPIVLGIMFLAAAIVLSLLGSAVSWSCHREWKKNRSRSSMAPFRLPLAKKLESSVYTLGAIICWTAAIPEWRFRALCGGVGLLWVMQTIHRLKSGSRAAPDFDDASVLHVEPAGNHASTLNS